MSQNEGEFTEEPLVIVYMGEVLERATPYNDLLDKDGERR